MEQLTQQLEDLLRIAPPEHHATITNSLTRSIGAISQNCVDRWTYHGKTDFIETNPEVSEEQRKVARFLSGDNIFQVSRCYLESEPNSFFTNLLSDRWDSDSDEPHDLHFPDSEALGILFLYLMRGPAVFRFLPLTDAGLRKRLLECANYFCVVTFKDYLHYPAEMFDLPDEDLAMKRRIDTLRHLFAMDRTNSLLQDAYLDLVSVFRDPSVLDRRPERWSSPRLFDLRREFTPAQSFRDWHDVWADATMGLFVDDFDWSNIVCAGGSVLKAIISPKPKPRRGGHFYHAETPSDIDLFLWGLTPAAALDKLRQLDVYIQHRCRQADPDARVIVVRTKHAISWIGAGIPKVQVILRLYRSPSEVLYGFDVDCVCVLYDGHEVWALPRAVRAIQQRCNLFDLGRTNVTFNSRIIKYAHRGFALSVPGFSWDRVEMRRIYRGGLPVYFSSLLRKAIALCRVGYGISSRGRLAMKINESETLNQMRKELVPLEHDPVRTNPIPDELEGGDSAQPAAEQSEPTGRRRGRKRIAKAPKASSALQETPVGKPVSIVTPRDKDLPKSGYDDVSAHSVRGLYMLWCACYSSRSPIRFLGAANVDDAVAGRFDMSLIPELDGMGHGGIDAERFCGLLEQGGFLHKPLEWIQIDLDRSFIGTFHHPIAAEYFDCYKN